MMTTPMGIVGRGLLAGAAAILWLAGPPAAQPLPAASDVPDTFRLEVGGFRLGSDTQLTLNTTGGSRPPVDFESLDVPETATRFYVEGFWRPWRRHQFSLSFYRVNRDGDPTTLQREIVWGDRVLTAGTTARARVASSYWSGVYRFAAYKNDRVEVGPAVGLGLLSLEAGIAGEITAAGAAGSESERFDVSRSRNQPTGDLGAYVYWWPLPRLLVRGDMRYIFVSPGDSEASITDGRAAVLYHPLRNLGVGLQYTYTKFRYERDVLSTDLGGHLRYSGGQLVVSAAF